MNEVVRRAFGSKLDWCSGLRHGFLAGILLVFYAPAVSRADDSSQHLRPPAVPLLVSDPYFSIWSEADRLTDDVTRHWTHTPHPLTSLVRVDGQAYRLMGPDPKDVPALSQKSLQVTPTRTLYRLEGAGVEVDMTFMTPALPGDLNVLDRPLTYLTWNVRATDGKEHQVSLYFDALSTITVNVADEPVTWNEPQIPGLKVLKVGSQDQPVLAQAGDDIRIDWGYLYLAAPQAEGVSAVADSPGDSRQRFISGQPIAGGSPLAATGSPQTTALAFAFELGEVREQPVSRYLMAAYDEIYSVKYAGTNLRPYWRSKGAEPADLLAAAAHDYEALKTRCADFDQELMTDAESVGGSHYAEMVALAYRQVLAGCGLAADANGQPLLFTKENTSNGDIATVDVIYPMEPIWLLLSPALAKASLVPVLAYAASDRWKFPNAPHDLGTYPLANASGDASEAMAVEESGNLLILTDAVAQVDGNASFVQPYWPQLTQWAQYLEKYGLDPEDQLCTDDFMGHLAHNANLSIKAIVALASYGNLCAIKGDAVGAAKYNALAKIDAAHFMKVADAGDHSLLAFDKPGTWSQKYNLVWDRILGLNVFPPELAAKEIAFYKTKLNTYGLPLDSRTKISKGDWTMWCASIAHSKADFIALTDPLFNYLNLTTAHSPFADSYVTDDLHSDGMHARPVIGGIFIRLLTDPEIWKKWATNADKNSGNWAAMPNMQSTSVLGGEKSAPTLWRTSTSDPGASWMSSDFDDSEWPQQGGGLGNDTPFPLRLQTMWDSPDVWMRTHFTLPADNTPNVQLAVFVDGDVDIYLNGVLATSQKALRMTQYANLSISDAARATLKPGENVLAVHCHHSGGSDTQVVDVGLVALSPP